MAYVAGSLPFSNMVARSWVGIDLRGVATGTVSVTNVHRVAGLRAAMLAAVLDGGKGGLALLVLKHQFPAALPIGAGAVVAGHNWSPMLRGAGGRGLAPSIGALLVINRPAAAVLLGGLLFGRITGDTAPFALAGQIALIPAMAIHEGPTGALKGAAVVLPMLAKRLLGNARLGHPRTRWAYLTRLVYDRDAR
jgi:acyl phosphate:glycerol-3-phosphate acyltransferase